MRRTMGTVVATLTAAIGLAAGAVGVAGLGTPNGVAAF
jgi:hypothetical protein